jgi:hypothetical protein
MIQMYTNHVIRAAAITAVDDAGAWHNDYNESVWS